MKPFSWLCRNRHHTRLLLPLFVALGNGCHSYRELIRQLIYRGSLLFDWLAACCSVQVTASENGVCLRPSTTRGGFLRLFHTTGKCLKASMTHSTVQYIHLYLFIFSLLFCSQVDPFKQFGGDGFIGYTGSTLHKHSVEEAHPQRVPVAASHQPRSVTMAAQDYNLDFSCISLYFCVNWF